MIAKNCKLFVATTTVAALSGVALAVAYMATNKQEYASYLLVITQFVVVACLVGWLINLLLLALLPMARYLSQAVALLVSRKARSAEDGPDWELIRIRREMIAMRLSVDELRFCTRCGTPCNCWSFCGEVQEFSAEQNALTFGYPVSLANRKSETDNTSIVTIENRNVSDCPFL